jgi:hypothetical protein
LIFNALLTTLKFISSLASPSLFRVSKEKLQLDKEKKYGCGEVLSIGIRNNNITQETYSLGDNINCRAIDILHKAKRINESDALKLLGDAKSFLESIYKK